MTRHLDVARRLALAAALGALSPPSPPRPRSHEWRWKRGCSQRHEVAPLGAPRRAHHRGRLDGPRRLGQRAAGHHRHHASLRAHDVQGHEDDRHHGLAEDRGSSSSRTAAWRDAGGDDDHAREAPARRDRRHVRPEADPALQASSRSVRRAVVEAARAHRQGRARRSTPGTAAVPERLHQRGPDRLLRPPAENKRALVLDRVRPAAEPGVPRVLLRARRGPGGAPPAHRVDADRLVRRGFQRDVLEVAARTTGRSSAGRPTRGVHEGQAEDVLRDLLRAQQHHRRLVGDFNAARDPSRCSRSTLAALKRGVEGGARSGHPRSRRKPWGEALLRRERKRRPRSGSGGRACR